MILHLLTLLCLCTTSKAFRYTSDSRWLEDETPGFFAQDPRIKFKRLDVGTLNTRDDTVYQPLRIKFITEPLETRRGESDAIDQQIDEIINEVLPYTSSTWSQFLYVIPVTTSISIPSGACAGAFGSLTPTVVDDADLVVVVGGSDTLYNNGTQSEVCLNDTLALATPCALDQFNDRPVIGLMNFCLGKNQTGSPLQGPILSEYEQHTGVQFNSSEVVIQPTVVGLHEMAHILAFNSALYKYYRYPDGTPRVPRPFGENDTISCVDGSEIQGTFPVGILNLTLAESGRVSYQMITSSVQQAARNQFDCQGLEGARLDDYGDNCFGAHWHERWFYGELMGPVYSPSSQNALSSQTLALMEDSGFYKVNFRNAESMAFGKASGCPFVDEACIQNETVPTFGTDAFCDTALRMSMSGVSQDSLNNIFCDPDHKSWTICDLVDERDLGVNLTTPDTIHYFKNKYLVPVFQQADSCPIPDLGLGLDCTIQDTGYIGAYFGEATGAGSRCFNAFTESGDIVQRLPACLPVRCDDATGTVVVFEGTNEQTCEYDFQVIAFPFSTNSSFVCPKLSTVCPQLFACPSECSGQGVCDYASGTPVCVCNDNATSNEGCYPFEPETGPTNQTTSPAPTSQQNTSPTASSTPFEPTSAPFFGGPTSPPIAGGPTLPPIFGGPTSPPFFGAPTLAPFMGPTGPTQAPVPFNFEPTAIPTHEPTPLLNAPHPLTQNDHATPRPTPFGSSQTPPPTPSGSSLTPPTTLPPTQGGSPPSTLPPSQGGSNQSPPPTSFGSTPFPSPFDSSVVPLPTPFSSTFEPSTFHPTEMAGTRQPNLRPTVSPQPSDQPSAIPSPAPSITGTTKVSDPVSKTKPLEHAEVSNGQVNQSRGSNAFKLLLPLISCVASLSVFFI